MPVEQRFVQMSDCPTMHWKIPSFPKNDDVIRVPPIVVKVAIGKTENFAHSVEKGVEKEVKKGQPDQMIG